MSDLKTKPTDESVERFLEGLPDEKQRQDCLSIVELMREATKAEPKMWGSSIVGFGSSHYQYASGRSGDWFVAGFSPRKQNLTLYLASGFEAYDALLNKLGKHKTGKSCLYIKRLADIDLAVLKQLIKQSVEQASTPGA
jgi:hypothetical protein